MPTPTTQPTEPLTEERLAAIEARCAAATPADTITFARYDHGGGRAYVDGQVGARQLVLDVYDEVNREFYYAARTDVSDLVAEVRRLRSDVDTATAFGGIQLHPVSQAEWCEWPGRPADGPHADDYGNVVDISWHEASAYAAWRGGRLPTSDELDALWGPTLTVAEGDVWEWTSSPFDIYRPDGPRVVRGGSWYFSPEGARAGFRGWADPDYRFGDFGFRLVLAAPDPLGSDASAPPP